MKRTDRKVYKNVELIGHLSRERSRNSIATLDLPPHLNRPSSKVCPIRLVLSFRISARHPKNARESIVAVGA